MGDDIAIHYTIHTTLINPFIGCILPILIQKCVEYLSFSCPDDTLDRVLQFLKAIVQNYHSRDMANNEKYFWTKLMRTHNDVYYDVYYDFSDLAWPEPKSVSKSYLIFFFVDQAKLKYM